MSLATPLKVGKLQRALHVKAKAEPEFRFYQLYDKIYRGDVLLYAYRLCRANAGAPGVDGMTFEKIEARGLTTWLEELAVDLRKKSYSADPVRRVWIPKEGGKGERPLGIPTVRDRVVQTAVVVVLEPIFEADLQPEQYAYRRQRNAHDAVRRVHRLVRNGYDEVIDADLSGYFDSIPHAALMRSVARRVSDRWLLALIKQWLVAAVAEDDEHGGKRRTNRARREKKGVPQGAPISPLLANLYMRRFLLGWKVLGYQQRLGAYIVNYADDFVICCRGSAESAMRIMRHMMEQLDLTVNEDKTCLRHLPEESIDFLGYTIGRCYSPRTGRAYVGTRPSKKSIQRTTARISALTANRMTLLEANEIVGRLNRLLNGWSNYFCLGPVSKAYRAVDAHTCRRLRQWLCHKHKIAGQGTSRYPNEYLYVHLGLVRLPVRTRNLPWAQT